MFCAAFLSFQISPPTAPPIKVTTISTMDPMILNIIINIPPKTNEIATP